MPARSPVAISKSCSFMVATVGFANACHSPSRRRALADKRRASVIRAHKLDSRKADRGGAVLHTHGSTSPMHAP